MSKVPTYDGTGADLLRAADVTTNIEDALRGSAEWGEDAQLESDKALAQLVQPFAEELGQAYDLLQAVIDARRRVSAEGVQLDNLGQIVGVPRQPATYSTVTLTFTGADEAEIPLGTRVKSSGSDVQWETIEAGEIDGTTDDVPAQCKTIGAQEATAGSLDVLVDLPPDITAVTNAAAAVTGDEIENDPVYRRRIGRSLSAGGTARPAAIRAVLEQLDFITAASVIENTTLETDSRGIPGNSYRPVVLPSGLSAAQAEMVILAIWLVTPAGIRVDGSESYTVTDDQGYEQPIGYQYGSGKEVYIKLRVWTTDAFPSDGTAQLVAGLKTFDNDYSLGSKVLPDDLRDYLRDEVPGIEHMEIWLKWGGSPTEDDTMPLSTEADEYPYFDSQISIEYPS